MQHELASAITEVLTGRCEPSNPVQDFAPIRYTNVVSPLAELVVLESQVSSDVWVIQPIFEADLKFFREVIKENIENRSIDYRYLVPNTKSVLRSLKRLREALDVTDDAWRRVSVRVVEPCMVESEVVIYDAYTEREKVFLMSPLEDEHLFWFRVRGSRALTVRDRYEALWSEASDPISADAS